MKLFRPASTDALQLFDSLEPRLALFAAPFLSDFPDISDLAHPQNTVLRMQTNMGMIDIELYDQAGPDGLTSSAAPLTTENFLRYVESGLFEESFFHRAVPGFVIQGGGYLFDEETSNAVRIETFDPIQNEFSTSRLNLERTLSMAKLGGDPDSATSQFFISLEDNPHLDTQNGGFSVFGRVISGWDIVQSIAGLDIQDVNQILGQQMGGPLADVPITQSISGTDITRDHLVHIIDIDAIKPAETANFFGYSLYFPDGYRSGNSSATVNVVNINPNSSAHYQIIARYETAKRDTVIASGALTPGASVSIPVHIAGDPSVDLVRGRAPFAYEIRATQQVAATIQHADFGATATQSFINPRDFEAGDLREWNFALGQKGTGVPSFLVWQNLSDQTASITVRFTSETGETHEMGTTLEAFRRGGLNVNQISAVPDGAYTVSITSDLPIVAALSQYRNAPARAAIETASVGGPALKGVLPAAIIDSGGQSLVSAALPQTPESPVTIDFQFILADGTTLNAPGLFVLDADTLRRDVDVSAAHPALPLDEFFTIRYSVRDNAGAMPVSVSYLGLVDGQMIRSGFQTVSSQEVYFAGGFTNPESENANEYISIYNPHLDPNVTVTYRLRFHFTNGDVFAGPAGEGILSPGEAVHVPIRTLSLIMNEINKGGDFQFYGITVSTEIRDGEGEVSGAVFAQYSRLDPEGHSASHGPTLGSAGDFPRFFLTNPIFG